MSVRSHAAQTLTPQQLSPIKPQVLNLLQILIPIREGGRDSTFGGS